MGEVRTRGRVPCVRIMLALLPCSHCHGRTRTGNPHARRGRVKKTPATKGEEAVRRFDALSSVTVCEVAGGACSRT